MSDRYWAKIWIGGPMPDHLMEDFRLALCDAGLISGNEDLANYLSGRGALEFDDCEAVNGNFEELEEWLILNGIDFDRQSDGYCEFSPCLAMFRKDVGQKDFVLDHDGYHVMRVDDVLRLIDQNPDMGGLILKLREETGQNLPPLKPFFGTAAQPVAADELKRRNTDPTATVCAQCGKALADPGMGPAFKHCPNCEP